MKGGAKRGVERNHIPRWRSLPTIQFQQECRQNLKLHSDTMHTLRSTYMLMLYCLYTPHDKNSKFIIMLSISTVQKVTVTSPNRNLFVNTVTNSITIGYIVIRYDTMSIGYFRI